MDSESERPETDFEAVFRRLWQLDEKGYKLSAFRLAEEIRRRARDEQRLIPYLYANFLSMNCAQALFDHRVGVDRAVETIALLESEEKARELQPDLPLQEYEETIHWLSACAYDNLAKHYAMREGYGREELQGLVQEGFDVCRRTGKLQCLTCFREYAVDVYEMAGDLDLALHFARSIQREVPLSEHNDRRSVGATQCARALMLLGRLEEASQVAEAAVGLAKSSFDRLGQRVRTQCQFGEILSLLGCPEELEERCAVVGEPVDWSVLPPREENPEWALRKALFDSVYHACRGEIDQAIEKLQTWDEWLIKNEVRSEWFEVRLRLVALHMLAGNTPTAELLARGLRQEARRRKAWLYLSRLAALDRGEVPPSPVAFLKPPATGLFALGRDSSSAEGTASPADKVEGPPRKEESAPVGEGSRETKTESDEVAQVAERATTGLSQQMDKWVRQVTAEGMTPDQVEGILLEMLSVDPNGVANPEEGARLIYLAGQLAEILGRQSAVWGWAKQLMGRYPESGDVLNLAATAAFAAWWATQEQGSAEPSEERAKPDRGNSRPEGIPTLEEIEAWFRKSLDLSPDYPRHYTRAGQFFRVKGDLGMAEWCLARSFALNRNNPDAALGLAQIYSDGDRDQDALAVLDLCLRDGGCQSAEVAWEAGVVAFRLTRYPDALTYFNQAEAWGWDNPWLYFYRGWTLLELGQIERAEADVERFAKAHSQNSLGIHVLRAWLASLKGDDDLLRHHVRAALSISIQQVEDLSETGIEKNLQQLYRVVQARLPLEDSTVVELIDRLFQAGIVPDEIFEGERRRRPRMADLNYYICVLRQPLDETWSTHPACWPHQANWPAYFAFWGVLARNTEEAEHYVLQAQSRCYPQPAELLSTTFEEGGFFDHPGVVWQGVRRYDENLEAIYSGNASFEDDETSEDPDLSEDFGDDDEPNFDDGDEDDEEERF